tara:strand:- start:295 stop:483 length:189 start_codon:yes stop_codon:yes gene_type:complete
MTETTVLLQPVGIVHTPANLKELENYIAKFSGGEALAAFTCAYMAWNLACKLTNPEGKSAND